MRLYPINLLSSASSELESAAVLYCSPKDQNVNLHSSEHFRHLHYFWKGLEKTLKIEQYFSHMCIEIL
jgi:hypothetical protein